MTTVFWAYPLFYTEARYSDMFYCQGTVRTVRNVNHGSISRWVRRGTHNIIRCLPCKLYVSSTKGLIGLSTVTVTQAPMNVQYYHEDPEDQALTYNPVRGRVQLVSTTPLSRYNHRSAVLGNDLSTMPSTSSVACASPPH